MARTWIAGIVLLLSAASAVAEDGWRGYFATESRLFGSSPEFAG